MMTPIGVVKRSVLVAPLAQESRASLRKLALVGALSPHLNSREAMKTEKGRKEIADIIEEILIPSVSTYIQPDDCQVNLRAHEHAIYKDHLIEHLTNMVAILKHTTTREVDDEQWMYAAEVGIVVQAMPTEVTYWQEILSGEWLALHLWSSVTTETKKQTIQTLQKPRLDLHCMPSIFIVT
jgi:hypothetical protein